MSRHDICYNFQHYVIPDCIFDARDRFVYTVLDNEGVLFSILNELFVGEGEENPYKKEDISIEKHKITEEIYALKINFPEPEEPPLCYYSYVFFDSELEKFKYFTVEKSTTLDGKEAAYLCGWNEEQEHLNYGMCEKDSDDVVLRCIGIFLEK